MKKSRTSKEILLKKSAPDGLRTVQIDDERTSEAEQALGLIDEYFQRADRHSTAELRSAIAEKRLRLLEPFDFHQLALLDEKGAVIATIAGVYLAGLNAGFITYLVVSRENRNRRIGKHLRAALVENFETNARRAGRENLNWVLGEIRIDSPWLMTLVRSRDVIPFDLDYFHPGLVPGESETRYVLYREIFADERPTLSADETRRVLYAIYRRGYRVRYPLEHPNFQAMLEQLESRTEIGSHPEVLERAGIEASSES